MAIDYDVFFERAGKAFYAGNAVTTAAGTTVPAAAVAFTQELGGSLSLELEKAREPVRLAVESQQSAAAGTLASLVRTPIQTLLVETVKADNPLSSPSAVEAVRELIRQMLADSESVDASAPSIVVSYGGDNTGTGVVVTSVKRGDGRVQEHTLDETMTGTFTGETSLTLKGTASVGKLAYNFPQGSGASLALSTTATSLVSNGSFETADTNSSNLPQGWVASVATLGTTLKLSNVEVQTVAMTGTPTAGSYTLSYTNAAGKVQTTKPLAYNASGSDVQTALRALSGLESVTVVTTGTTPNYTHTVTFTGVTNPAQLTSTDSTTGGTHTLTHATTTAASANVMAGARALEFDSNGSQLTAIQQLVSPQATSQYAVNLWAMVDSVPAAGVVTVDLVDGIGGSVIADDQGVNNTFTIDCTALTTSYAARNGVFRTPTVLPELVYLRIRITTAVSNTSSVWVDDVRMVAMQKLYSGGPYAAVFPGPVAFVSGDTAELEVTNAYDGAIQQWMNRVFDLSDNELLIPSNSGGSETIADSLIS